jgi:predicted anti-sigma-YlaC factor YlaD
MSQPEKPTELIHLSRASAAPALFALGLAAVIVGLYSWWPYSVAGGLIVLGSLFAWLRGNRDEIAGMPRRQHTDTAPVPLSVSRPSD